MNAPRIMGFLIALAAAAIAAEVAHVALAAHASDAQPSSPLSPDTPPAAGPGNVFTIRSATVSAGAARSSGGPFDSSSSSGQPAAGEMSGGDFTMGAGIVATVSCGGCQLFGDIQPAFGNCTVNLDDILCVLNGFGAFPNCPGGDLVPCGGNGIVNLDDILAVLAAFGGNYACPHPCPQ